MSIEKEIQQRSTNKCELCGSEIDLSIYEVQPPANIGADGNIHICSKCKEQYLNPENADANHWRCLNDSMWSQIPAVQVLAWRMLNNLKNEGWTSDLLDMMYMEDETLKWAKSGFNNSEIKHLDCNGVQLNAGDNVVLIKDLDVKGSSITAKRGAAVRRISLDHDNPEYIEGKVDGQHIVILTKYVKKSN